MGHHKNAFFCWYWGWEGLGCEHRLLVQGVPAESPGGAARTGSGTPRGLASAPEQEKLKPAMDALHGHALGVASLLIAATRWARCTTGPSAAGPTSQLCAAGATTPETTYICAGYERPQACICAAT